MASVVGLGTALPPRVAQADLRAAAAAFLGGEHRILETFDNARIERRALAMPLPWYLGRHGFKERNAQFVRVGLDLAQRAAGQALEDAGVAPDRLRGVVCVSTTGIATPSLDARLANRMGFPADAVRLPVWGLGCGAGVAGLARAAELAEARRGPVLLVALELCSLSFDVARTLRSGAVAAATQAAGAAGGVGVAGAAGAVGAAGVAEGAVAPVTRRGLLTVAEPDKKAMVAASLFADGCAAAVVAPGDEPGLRVVATASHLWPGTERVMGWDVEDRSLDVVLSPDIPDIVRARLAAVVRPFLHGHLRGDPGADRTDGLAADRAVDPAVGPVAPDVWVLHPGGARVLDAFAAALGLRDDDLRHARAVLRDHGNMSSPTVLFVLQEAVRSGALASGRTALLAALGPGFASELALLEAT